MALKHYLRIDAFTIFLALAATGMWIYYTGGTGYLGSFKEMHPAYIILLFGIVSFCILGRFVRLQFIMRRIGVRIPTRRSLSIYLASLIGIATPAYLGEIIRGLFMRREFRVPFRITLWVFVVERLLDLTALGIIGIFTVHTWEMTKELLSIMAVLFALGLSTAVLLQRTGVPQSAIKNLLSSAVLLPCVAVSLTVWIPAALLISIASAGYGVSLDYIEGMGVFSAALVKGSITLLPASIGTTGNMAIQQLEQLNIPFTQSANIVSFVLPTCAGVILFVGVIFLIAEFKVKTNLAIHGGASHFDEITPEYKDQFTSHVWDHLLDRKISFIVSALGNPASKMGTGLDIGCGLGKQCLAMNQRGYNVIGLDYSYNLAEQAHIAGVKVVNGDTLMLPFKESSFEYVYAIGALHHLQGMTAQEYACKEIVRILKPGGYFIVHETNTRNPLFRFYMGYLFPLIKSIDEGTEWWIEPQRWEKIEGMKLIFVKHFTFIPDFIPHFVMGPCLSIEKSFESSRLRFYSVHYMAVLQKTLE